MASILERIQFAINDMAGIYGTLDSSESTATGSAPRNNISQTLMLGFFIQSLGEVGLWQLPDVSSARPSVQQMAGKMEHIADKYDLEIVAAHAGTAVCPSTHESSECHALRALARDIRATVTKLSDSFFME